MDINIFSVIGSLWTDFSQSGLFFWIKIVAAFVIFILLIADILLLSKRIKTDVRIAIHGTVVPKFNKEKYREKWGAIMKRVSEDGGAAEKISLVEADRMLNDVLEKVGYNGKDAGEKIAQIAPGQLAGLDEVSAAHQLSEKILFDPSHEISPEEIKSALEAYEKFFNGLEIFG